MKTTVLQGDITTSEANVLIVGHLEDGGKRLGGALESIDTALGGEISAAITAKEITGKLAQILLVRTHGRIQPSHVIVVGLGTKKELTVERVRQAMGSAWSRVMQLNVSSVAAVLMGAGKGEQEPRAIAQALTEAALLTNYKFDTWKKNDDTKKTIIANLTLVEILPAHCKLAVLGCADGEVFAQATIVARDLVNEAPSHMVPMELKRAAEAIAKSCPEVSLKVLDRAAAKKRGMNAFLAVAAGSTTEPYFLHLTYTPNKPTKKSIALVGKGITFDSGGLSLKPADGMMTMKCDMAGAATVLGIFSALGKLQPTMVVHGLIAACENMPSGSAYRPGDVVTAMNGTTIEVLNTDAEGRVTLADALSYATELRPNAIIDLATLTGACVVALGEEIVGVMTDNEKLAERVLEASYQAGEEFWELPLYRGYEVLIESKVADVQNIGVNRWGGALTAGLFLKKFVDPAIPWMHLDIAGPAFAEREYLSYVPYGGTGAGVRTVLQMLKQRW
ncbi:leucyl aminopeptidase [Candidatus Uhrbacteria bacterium CG10_big_fil_rev_8_21_14_0_10_50_16]|uniref:Probable cytosol aminopeptidase n=1 Tax=Candidatus Uhrbacteria bacterium CG10_big_fil_rev_8_21_14_0_10_50_16 TaxID=1975039 RepID=A0A2H0RMY1_9BACT|nr:MAG: leucyl aminopeptidase [Candidatus Uhrbacteria bacterium CG10_big_fil_rev_8_21_14_0_10_50_16]